MASWSNSPASPSFFLKLIVNLYIANIRNIIQYKVSNIAFGNIELISIW